MWKSWKKREWDGKEGKTDYDDYRLSWKEVLWGLC